MKKVLAFLCAFVLMETAVYGQALLLTAPKFPVEIMEESADPVGRLLITELKERIQKSTTMRLANEEEDRFFVVIITMNPDPESGDEVGQRTIYSVSITWIKTDNPFPLFLSANVGHCGAMLTVDCAERIAARIYGQIDRFVKDLDQEGRPSKTPVQTS